MTDRDLGAPLWKPSREHIAGTRLSAFFSYLRDCCGLSFTSYTELHGWSINEPKQFWGAVWKFADVIGEPGEQVLVDEEMMPGARWFPDTRLNFCENLLRPSANEGALVFWGEDKIKRIVSRAELQVEVARFASALRDANVGIGDRVAAYMPNMPETIVAMLATTSLGAVFTSASPDFGVQGLVDRFGQTTPKILIACDGYWYNGRAIDVASKLPEIVSKLPSVTRLVLVPYLNDSVEILANSIPNAVSLARFVAPHLDNAWPQFQRVPFNHPLYIVYSSGTTGTPKCIVHGTGSTLLQHLKEQQLHSDVRTGDKLFYYTTCGWMMWNWLASGLASGATLLLYDGNPFVDDGRILWNYAEAEGATHFGTSAKYLESLARSSLHPGEQFDLRGLRVLLSTGSPLAPECFDFVYRDIKADVQLSSISGGTDIISCFVLGNPCLPVWRGEIQCAGLGLAVDVWNDNGKPVRGEKGELVCTRPFPSMPIGFWADASGERYRSAYFERFPGIWSQGDFCEITDHGGFIIHGRSDATLNPGGVRIGTAEIYQQVEKVPEVLQSIVVGQIWGNDVRVILFVTLKPGFELDEILVDRIKRLVRENTTARHVPAKILQVGDIPRTKTGKLVELAVRNVIHGEPVKNVEALANPEALAEFVDRAELRT